MRTISTIIIKPTKGCNADCTYCCAPPDGAPKWTINEFREIFDALEPRLHPTATLIWHGGEPMLLGHKFYQDALAYARSKHPGIRFSIQSNMLAYNHRWNEVFRDVFEGSVSTSWDPDELCRTMKGSQELYSRLYHAKMEKILQDGWRPKVISTFTDDTIHLAHEVYDRALTSSKRGHVYDIRLNYRYPAGRASEEGPSLLPEAYGRVLLEVYDRWITDTPDFLVTPLDQMFKKVTGEEIARCPWAKGCTGRIIGLEPNLDVYNCGEFADLGDPEYCFGNLLKDGIDACLSSPAARKLARRQIQHPDSCKKCIHFTECEAGCMRDSVLFGRGLYGKFFYCESWQQIFSRIKQSILTGEADQALIKFGHDPDKMRTVVESRLKSGLLSGAINMRKPVPGFTPDVSFQEGY
jgi:radical SAM protein with 4Fe4S-binding SPASM domain